MHDPRAAVYSWSSALAALALGASGCGGDPASPLADCVRGDGFTYEVTVTEGVSPQIAWTPLCRANGLEVVDLEPADPVGGTMWRISFSGRNGLLPGVRYGETPAGATELSGPAKPLEAGHRYGLDVAGLDALGGFVLDVVEFTP